MKKFYLSIIALMFVLFANAQTVEKVDGYYFVVSPNAQYYAGAQEGTTAFRYSLETKEENRIEPVSDFGFKTNAISNEGVVAGSYGFKAALWIDGDNYEFLPLPDGLSALEEATNDAVAISADGKQIVVAMNADAPKTYYVYKGDTFDSPNVIYKQNHGFGTAGWLYIKEGFDYTSANIETHKIVEVFVEHVDVWSTEDSAVIERVKMAILNKGNLVPIVSEYTDIEWYRLYVRYENSPFVQEIGTQKSGEFQYNNLET